MNNLDKLKKLRNKIWIKTIIIFFVLCIIIFLPLILNKSESISYYIKYILIFELVGIFSGYWINKSICENDIDHYKTIYAKNITLEILKTFFEDIKYKPNDDLLPKDFVKIIDNARIPTTNCYSNDDYIVAKYKNIQIEYSDIRLGYLPINSEDNQKNSFKGKWIVLTFNKNFNSNIQIGPRIFNGKKMKQMLKGKEYEEIELSDVDLKKKMVIYADNKDEVFNILTRSRINKIKQLYKQTRGKVFIFFKNNQIHIGIGDKKNYFEPSIYKRFDLEKEKDKINKQINIITEFIDFWI